MRTARFLGLRAHLILLLGVAFTALAGIFVWHSLDDRDDQIRATLDQLLDHTRKIALHQHYISATADAILNGLMLRPELRPGMSAKACSQTLQDVLQREPKFIQIGKVLPNGEVACSAIPARGRVSFADRNWFQQTLLTREMVIGDAVIGRIVGKPLITFAKAMRDNAGRITAVLYLSLDLAWLREKLTQPRLPAGARLLVMDGQGSIAVSTPELPGQASLNVANHPLFKHILASGGEGTTDEVGLDGVRRLIAYTPLLKTVSGRKYYLWLTVPTEMVTAPVQRTLMINLAIALAVLAGMTGLVAWGNSRRLVQPLLTLSRTAARFGAGELDARSGLPYTGDEVGELARTLDEMAATIQASERKLARANRALRVLSAGNRALLHIKDEQEAMGAMCRTLVETGGFCLAWAGYFENDSDQVRPARIWKASADCLENPQLVWDEAAAGREPTGTLIRRGLPVASSLGRTNPGDGRPAHRCASWLALPLRVDDSIIGALTLYAAEADAFDAEVIELLTEAADDLAFGIADLRRQAQHTRTQAALKAAEERFRIMFESSRDAIMTTAPPQWRFTAANPATLALFAARNEAEFSRIAPWEVSPEFQPDGEASAAKAARMIETALQQGSHYFEWTHRKLTGETFPATVLLTRMRLDGQDMILATVRDVTHEEAAKAQLHKLSLAVEQSPASILITNLDTRIEYVNEAFVRNTGYSREEAIGQKMPLLNSGKTPPENYAALWDALTRGRSWRGEFCNRRKDGSEYIDLAIISPIRQADGRITHYVSVQEDITEKKRLGAELARRTHELEESNRALLAEADIRRQIEVELRRSNTELEQIAYITTHDLQEPLRTVASFVQLLARRNRGRLDEESELFINFAVEGVTRMQAIIRDILEFSQVGSVMVVPTQPADTPAAFAEALASLREAIAAADARISCDPLPPVAGDRRQLTQLFQNLLSNALKYRSTEAPRIHVSATPEGKDWRFRVQDNGIGIDPRYHEKIFVIFQHLHSRAEYP